MQIYSKYRPFREMMLHMKRIIFKQSQISKVIIRTIAVNMMNMLGWFKVSSDFAFVDQSMFKNIASIITKWMIRLKNFYIFPRFYSSVFPHRVIDSSFSLRHTRTNFVLIPGGLSFFKFSLNMISFYESSKFVSHFITSIKMPFSACLAKTVKFSRLLRARFLDIKNPFSLSNLSITQTGGISI